MNKVLIFIFCFINVFSFSQAQVKTVVPTGSPNQIALAKDAMGADSVQMLPTGCGAPAINMAHYMTAKRRAAGYMDSCNHRLYVWDPKRTAWDTAHLGASS